MCQQPAHGVELTHAPEAPTADCRNLKTIVSHPRMDRAAPPSGLNCQQRQAPAVAGAVAAERLLVGRWRRRSHLRRSEGRRRGSRRTRWATSVPPELATRTGRPTSTVVQGKSDSAHCAAIVSEESRSHNVHVLAAEGNGQPVSLRGSGPLPNVSITGKSMRMQAWGAHP